MTGKEQFGLVTKTHHLDDDSAEVHFASGFVSVVPQLKRDLQEREGDTRRWTQVEPLYRYGWQMANRPDLDRCPSGHPA